MHASRSWDWGLFPGTEQFLLDQVDRFLRSHDRARELAARIERETATQLTDWIDHMVLPENAVGRDQLTSLGYRKDNAWSTDQLTVFRHDGGRFFPVILADATSYTLALNAESISDFQNVHAQTKEIEGVWRAPYRRLDVSREGTCLLQAVERRGYPGFVVRPGDDTGRYSDALIAFMKRKRSHSHGGPEELEGLVAGMGDMLDPSRVTDAFFRAERRYWTGRNRAAAIIKRRNDQFGLGFGNHDHHTFRSSREQFATLVRIFRSMGMNLRERFFAGAGAGWGAQILEHPGCGVVVFADVDLTADERETDFVREGLADDQKKGTVGLWVSLHGESIAGAGMHHLALRSAFDRAGAGLSGEGVAMMKPFSDFPFLRQAFTRGEMWKTDPETLEWLERNRTLEPGQTARFHAEGALGSHVEIIQRGSGFKGFNQDSVSVILRETDPRRFGVYGA